MAPAKKFVAGKSSSKKTSSNQGEKKISLKKTSGDIKKTSSRAAKRMPASVKNNSLTAVRKAARRGGVCRILKVGGRRSCKKKKTSAASAKRSPASKITGIDGDNRGKAEKIS